MSRASKLTARINEIVNRTLASGTAARLVVRGYTYPLDPYAFGTVRFAKKAGFLMPLILADNTFSLSEDAIFGTDQLELETEPLWIVRDSYVSIGGTELRKVSDVVDTTVILDKKLLADHPAGLYVYHYSSPIVVEGNYSVGKYIINVDTPYLMTFGDVIGISSNADQPDYFVEYNVVDITQTGSTASTIQYQITLDKPIHRDLEDEEIIQLRAYPAYFSKILPLPSTTAQLPLVGPFLVDWVSGNWLANHNIDEVQTLKLYDTSRNLISPPIIIEKNHQILNIPIRADQFLFWDVVAGTVNYNKATKQLIAELNDDGEWWVKYTCAPLIKVPYTNASGYIICTEPTNLVNNDYFILTDATDSITFDYKVDASYTPIPSSAAAAIITVTGIPSDNDTFTLDDGFGHVITFEFKRTGGFVPSDPKYRTVDITTAILATDVAIAMEQAINSVSILEITANNVGATLNLTNNNISQRGNTTIVVNSASLTITQQFINGTNPVVTIDVSGAIDSLEVAELTAALINSSGINMDAFWPGLSPSIRLVSRDQGPSGNIAITESVSHPDFSVNGMSGGTGGVQWNFKVKTDNDILFRVRLYPNDYQDYNITAGSTTSISVNLDPTDLDVERIDLLISGPANSNVYIHDWVLNGPRVGAIEHALLMKTTGKRVYASSTLLAKPLFHSLDSLKIKQDSGFSMNSGHLRL